MRIRQTVLGGPIEHGGSGQLARPAALGPAQYKLAAEMSSARLCFEHDPAMCHRTLLVEAVAPDAEVIDLFA